MMPSTWGCSRYTVSPGVTVSDTGLRTRVSAAMFAEGLISGQLRFASLPEAKAARDRLAVAVPGSEWTITRDASDGD